MKRQRASKGGPGSGRHEGSGGVNHQKPRGYRSGVSPHELYPHGRNPDGTPKPAPANPSHTSKPIPSKT